MLPMTPKPGYKITPMLNDQKHKNEELAKAPITSTAGKKN